MPKAGSTDAAHRAPTVLRRAGRWATARSPRLGALIDRRRPETIERWNAGFNGQPARRRLMKEVVSVVEFDAFVETGTFQGATAEFVRRRLDLPVWTVELQPRSYELCRWRFRNDPEVRLHVGDSRSFLEKMTRDLAGRRCLFYLDAHWYDDLPLDEEMRIISRAWNEWVVVIDDFKVDDDPGYSYDDYGPGRALEFSYLPRDEMQPFEAFFPSTPGAEDSWPARGCIVLGRGENIVSALRGCSTLRPAAPFERG